MTTPLPRPVAVIGAGAAGLMAAIHAARAGARVILLERTRDGGRKILISGGGRCNILPSELDPSRFVSDSPASLVRRLLASWPLPAQRAFFETDLGLRLVVEPESGKLFPVSNRAREVRDALVSAACGAGAEPRFGAHVTGVDPEAGGWRVALEGGEEVRAGAVIVGTGGLSVPATGSDGFGLGLARRLGHVVHQTYPALTPLTADPPVHAALAGLSLSVTLRARTAGRRITTRGGFLFTHRGYSGPAVLDISHLAVRSRLRGDDPRQSIQVQWSEDDRETWDRRLQQRSRQSVLAVLRESLPSRLAERLILEARVDPAIQLAQLPREGRRELVIRLSDYDLPWTGDEGYQKAEVTGGGVALGEVDPATLESPRHRGLYFCGEVLDAFGPIGGYNFAWAWATGRAAGLGAAKAHAKG
jgi:predicted Rossmann fold flavoprotein